MAIPAEVDVKSPGNRSRAHCPETDWQTRPGDLLQRTRQIRNQYAFGATRGETNECSSCSSKGETVVNHGSHHYDDRQMRKIFASLPTSEEIAAEITADHFTIFHHSYRYNCNLLTDDKGGTSSS